LRTISSESSSFIWDEEVKLKRKFKLFKYNPSLNFKGYTECFDVIIKDKLIDYLNNIEKGKGMTQPKDEA